MSNITISVSKDDVIYTVCYNYDGLGFFNTMESFECYQPIEGKRVKVQRSTPILNICELEIYGHRLPMWY